MTLTAYQKAEGLYPSNDLAALAIEQGFTVTPELVALLISAYDLGVEDTY